MTSIDTLNKPTKNKPTKAGEIFSIGPEKFQVTFLPDNNDNNDNNDEKPEKVTDESRSMLNFLLKFLGRS